MNQSNEATRSARMIGALFLTALAALALLVPAGSAAPRSLGNIHGCGVLVDAAHPWRSQVPGGNVETGDHWITDRQGAHGSCAFTHATIKKLLALAPRTYQGGDVGHLEGGLQGRSGAWGRRPDERTGAIGGTTVLADIAIVSRGPPLLSCAK